MGDKTEKRGSGPPERAANPETPETLGRLKADFLNLISHELRTPLTVILGNAPLLTDPARLPDPDEIAAIAGEMEREGEKLLAMVNDIIDFSRIGAGRLKLEMKQIDAGRIAEAALEKVRPLAREKGLDLVREGDPLFLRADPARLEQILVNLLENAVKFTDAGSVRISAGISGGMARFEVSDTGRGIPPADLDRIFETFRQVDSSSTRTVPGIGLGLAITRRLVELHGGRIRAESRGGGGSTFIFTLPVKAADGGRGRE